jgi:hypothetical protein
MQKATSITPAQWAVLADMCLAGLAFDVEDGPAVWQVSPPEPQALPSVPARQALAQPLALARELPANPEPPLAPVWQVWQAGDPGGVCVLLAAEQPPQAEALALLKNILKAVGLQDLPLGFVGLSGASGAVKGGAAAALIGQTGALQPLHTLVLGQDAVAALVGKSLGVEGWHAAPLTLGLPGCVGVTYTLEMLLKNPLFKRLAWQHLQRWQLAREAS